MTYTSNPSRALILSTLALTAGASQAALLRITVEAASNVGLAPAAISFHDGTNDFFDTGSAASAGLEALAEVGDTSGLISSLVTGNNVSLNGGGGPFAPGASNSVTIDVDSANTTFSFAAMVLPSNDWFIGNNTGIDVSAIVNGTIGTAMTFDFGRVYDAGTELEDFSFSPGNPLIGVTTPATPGGGAVQGDNISLVDDANPFSAFLNPSAGFDPTTFDFNAAGVGNTPIGRVTITNVPEPGTAFLGVFGALGLLLRRRR